MGLFPQQHICSGAQWATGKLLAMHHRSIWSTTYSGSIWYCCPLGRSQVLCNGMSLYICILTSHTISISESKAQFYLEGDSKRMQHANGHGTSCGLYLQIPDQHMFFKPTLVFIPQNTFIKWRQSCLFHSQTWVFSCLWLLGTSGDRNCSTLYGPLLSPLLSCEFPHSSVMWAEPRWQCRSN